MTITRIPEIFSKNKWQDENKFQTLSFSLFFPNPKQENQSLNKPKTKKWFSESENLL